MQLLCPQCGNAIAGADIDLSRGMGVCRPCGELVPFPSTVPAQLPLTNASTSLYRPESLRFEERASDEAYEVTLPPNRLATLPLLFFTLFWDGFMIVWYAISSKAIRSRRNPTSGCRGPVVREKLS